MNPVKGKRFVGYWTRRRCNRTFEVFVNNIEILHYWSYIRPLGSEKKLEACYDPGGDMIRQARETIEESKMELKNRASCF